MTDHTTRTVAQGTEGGEAERFQQALYLWQLKPLLPASVVGMGLSTTLTLTYPEPLLLLRFHKSMTPVVVFVVVHCVLIGLATGRFRSRSFGFLYAHGFSRKAVWRHTQLAVWTSVMMTWLPLALLIWLGIRSSYQDSQENPWFRWGAPLESSYPWVVLYLYVVLVSAVQYLWVSLASPQAAKVSATLTFAGLLWLLHSSLTSKHVYEGIDAYGFVMLAAIALAGLGMRSAASRTHEEGEVMA